MTRRFAVIGNPVAHSLSPRMQTAAFLAAGVDASYEAIAVRRERLADAMTTLRRDLSGFNVTTPLKEAVLAHLDALTPAAATAHAVNTVRVDAGRMTGHNTDGLGLVAALRDVFGLEPRGKRGCVLGSGPAARAIAFALRDAGAADVACWSRNAAAAAEIGAPPAGAFDVAISALPASAVVPEAVLDSLRDVPLVFDVNYAADRSPIPTSLGGRRSDGLPLLLHQGALAFEWWTGLPAPLDAMRAALSL